MINDDSMLIGELPYDWKKIDNKTILISGGSGFVGSLFSDVIRYRNSFFGQRIKVISLSRHGGIDDETVKNVRQDVSQLFEIDEHIDYIIHLASNTHPLQYSRDPVGTILTNVIGCNNLLEIAKNKSAAFLLASSCEIYGDCPNEPIAEDYCGYINCNNARSGYNEAKRVSESLLQSYRSQYGVKGTIIRFSRIFGADRKKDSKAISQFLDFAVSGKDIVLKSVGDQQYSFCYVADAVSAIFKVLIDGVDGEAYNVSEDNERLTLRDYAGFIADLCGVSVINSVEDNAFASKSHNSLLNCEKIKKLGWQPLFSVRDGLKRTVEMKKNG